MTTSFQVADIARRLVRSEDPAMLNTQAEAEAVRAVCQVLDPDFPYIVHNIGAAGMWVAERARDENGNTIRGSGDARPGPRKRD